MSNSRTHYIPISGITIDTINDAITDAVNDAVTEVVGEILNPDPAVYCPINGYTKPGEPTYETPVSNLPEPVEGEIVLLCSNEGKATVSIYATPAYNVKIYNSLNEELVSANNGSGATYTYNFPTDGGLKYYYVVIKGQTSPLTLFRRGTTSGFLDYSIIEAKINCPSLTSLLNGFNGVSPLRKCTMVGDYNSLTTMNSIFTDTDIEEFTFPANMNVLNNLGYAFLRSGVIHISGNFSAPLLTTMIQFARNCTKLLSLNLTITNSKINNFTDFVSFCPLLKNIDVSTINSTPDSACDLSRFAQNAANLENASLPTIQLPVTTDVNCANFFEGCSKLKKIKFNGRYSLAPSLNPLNDCLSLEELDYGVAEFGTMQVATWPPTVSYAKNFKKIKFPDTWQATTTAITPQVDSNIVEVSGVSVACNNAQQTHMQIRSSKLAIFSLPKVAPTTVLLGAVGAPITEVNIDWANKSLTNANHITVRGSLPSSEINRIYGLLPLNDSGFTLNIYFQDNPGFAGADHSIARAKNWTVVGA